MNKNILYTVNLDNYDAPPPLSPLLVSGFRCVMVTDDPDMEAARGSAWELLIVDREEDPHRHQRRLKICWWELFPEAETIIYVDASLHIRHALKHLIPLHSETGFTTGTHPIRKCVYKEAEACEQRGKAPIAQIHKQVEAYKAEGIPKEHGMYQTGLIIRSNTQEVREFCKMWFTELSKHTHRDQLSIMAAAHKTGFYPAGIPWTTIQRFATLTQHKGKPKGGGIHYLIPYACDGNIGKALNDAIALVPHSQDWVVIRDGDCCFVNSNWGRNIEATLKNNGGEYEVFGALTNRIKSPRQQVPGMFDEMDLRKHVEVGFRLEKEHWGQAVDGGTGVAGFFMAFRKATWEKTPFRERDRAFDTLFCKDVRRNGGRIGIMSGVYLIHIYRLWSHNPTVDTKHLDLVDGGTTRRK